jgi:hypothetical protein
MPFHRKTKRVNKFKSKKPKDAAYTKTKQKERGRR